jgi:hypothetical protein
MGEFAIICLAAAGVPDHCTKHHSSLPSPIAMSCQRLMFSTAQSPIGPPHTHIRTRDCRRGRYASPPVCKTPSSTQ